MHTRAYKMEVSLSSDATFKKTLKLMNFELHPFPHQCRWDYCSDDVSSLEVLYGVYDPASCCLIADSVIRGHDKCFHGNIVAKDVGDYDHCNYCSEHTKVTY